MAVPDKSLVFSLKAESGGTITLVSPAPGPGKQAFPKTPRKEPLRPTVHSPDCSSKEASVKRLRVCKKSWEGEKGRSLAINITAWVCRTCARGPVLTQQWIPAFQCLSLQHEGPANSQDMMRKVSVSQRPWRVLRKGTQKRQIRDGQQGRNVTQNHNSLPQTERR